MSSFCDIRLKVKVIGINGLTPMTIPPSFKAWRRVNGVCKVMKHQKDDHKNYAININ
jgi:hypothetical protein